MCVNKSVPFRLKKGHWMGGFLGCEAKGKTCKAFPPNAGGRQIGLEDGPAHALCGATGRHPEGAKGFRELHVKVPVDGCDFRSHKS